jgi:hypothetical protein
MSYNCIEPTRTCCGALPVTEVQSLWNSYYTILDTCIAPWITKSFNDEVFGNDSQKDYDRINNFHYFFILLLIIADERSQDLAAGTVYDKEHYIEKYNLACIIKALKCNNSCSQKYIDQVLDLFDVNPIPFSTLPKDGIGYMGINPTSGTPFIPHP